MVPLASSVAAAQYAHHARLQLRHGVELLTDFAQPRVGETVVDVGCGCGELAWLAAHAVATRASASGGGGGGRVLGIDPDAARIALCHDRGTSAIVQSLLSDFKTVITPSDDGDGAPASATSTDARSGCFAPPSFAVGDASQLLDVAATAGIARGTVDLVFANHVVHWIADKVGFFHQALHLLRPGGRLVLQSPARDTRLLTRLTKLAHKSVGDRLARAISVADAAKLMRAAHAVGFDARPAHESVVVHRQRFESAADLFEWMEASTHGQWRAADISDAAARARFEDDEFARIFDRSLETHSVRLVLVRPSDADAKRNVVCTRRAPPPAFFEKRLIGRRIAAEKQAREAAEVEAAAAAAAAEALERENGSESQSGEIRISVARRVSDTAGIFNNSSAADLDGGAWFDDEKRGNV